jgi:anthranilate/para-aminobenzoate synthase component II
MFIARAATILWRAAGLILLLDNKDSFVWNLAQALGALGAEVRVVRSDASTSTRSAARARS